MAETIYVPGSSAKARDTQFGQVIKLSFKFDELGKFAKAHKNEKGYVNLEIVPRKSESKFGDTHSVKLDTWTPKEDGGGQKQGGGGKPAGKPAQKPAPKKVDPFEGDGEPVGGTDSAEDEPPF